MSKLGQRGVVQVLFLIILLAGLVAGIFLVQQTQIFKPKAAPTLTPTPTPGNGDGNKDGKVDLIDLSVLLTDYNQSARKFRPGIDLNGDGVINAFDFSLMRKLLIEIGVIKGI